MVILFSYSSLQHGIIVILDALACHCNTCSPLSQICTTSVGGFCFSALSPVESGKKVLIRGCLNNTYSTMLQCRAHFLSLKSEAKIQCCQDYDFCNNNSFVSDLQQTEDLNPSPMFAFTARLSTAFTLSFTLLVVLIVGVTLFCLLFSPSVAISSSGGSSSCNTPDTDCELLSYSSPTEISTNGNGKYFKKSSVLSLLTIVKESTHSSYYRGSFNFDPVFVKYPHSYRLWDLENKILHQLTNSDFVAACLSSGEWQAMNSNLHFYIAVPYFDKGSLLDLLRQNTVISPLKALELIHSGASALAYLHMQIIGNERKHPIAHLNIKPSKFLLKNYSGLCLTDFSCAVEYYTEIPPSPRLSCYSSPEILLNLNSLGVDLLSADVYSFGLVAWEISCKVFDQKHLTISDRYNVENLVEIYSTTSEFPLCTSIWEREPMLAKFEMTFNDCIAQDPRSRTTVLCVKKQLATILSSHKPTFC